MALPLIGMAALAAYGIISSYSKQSKAEKGLSRMEGRMPQYRTIEDIQREAKTMARGFEPAELAAARMSQMRAANAAYRLGTQTNPNLASTVQSGINYATIASTADLAAKDAQMRRENQNRLAQSIANLDRAKTGEERAMFQRAAAEYGAAIQEARQERSNYITSLIYAGSQYAGSKTGTPKTDIKIDDSTTQLSYDDIYRMQNSVNSGSYYTPYKSNYEIGYDFK